MSFLVNGYFSLDTDALAYIQAVEAADGQALEETVKLAINDFVQGCKADGTWTKIQTSCILAGARTLAGAIVPLVGVAPNASSFTGSDYSRKTGLKGGNKQLNLNRSQIQDGQDNVHMSLYCTATDTSVSASVVDYMGTSFATSTLTVMGYDRRVNPSRYITRVQALSTTGAITVVGSVSTGFWGVTRSSNSSITTQFNSASTVSSHTSASVTDRPYLLFNSSTCDARISFYSIGQSLNLVSLESRINALMNAYTVAIP